MSSYGLRTHGRLAETTRLLRGGCLCIRGASGHCMDVSSLPVADCVQQAGLVTVNASDKGHGPPVGDRKYVYA